VVLRGEAVTYERGTIVARTAITDFLGFDLLASLAFVLGAARGHHVSESVRSVGEIGCVSVTGRKNIRRVADVRGIKSTHAGTCPLPGHLSWGLRVEIL